MESDLWEEEADENSERRTTSDRSWGWIFVAILLALLLHAIGFFILKEIPFVRKFSDSWEWRSQSFHVERAVFSMSEKLEATKPTEEVAPPDEAAELLTEVEELLPKLIDTEIDISPQIQEPEVTFKLARPALSGEETGSLMEPIKGQEVAASLVDSARTEALFQKAARGQVIVDRGEVKASLMDPDEFNKTLTKKGAGGLSDSGVLEGYTSLQDMLRLPGAKLNQSKAMIGSDLLFEYNQTALREGARFSLMKVATIIELNPEMYCWIDGHADLYGTDEFNKELSHQRAQSVKDFLVDAFHLDPKKIIVRAFGESSPLRRNGSIEEQSVNRRVEIKIRRSPPNVSGPSAPNKPPPRAILVEEPSEPTPAPPALVPRALPVP